METLQKKLPKNNWKEREKKYNKFSKRSQLVSRSSLEGYCARKLFHCMIIAHNVQCMNFVTWKKNVSFSRYLYFCAFDEFENFKNVTPS